MCYRVLYRLIWSHVLSVISTGVSVYRVVTEYKTTDAGKVRDVLIDNGLMSYQSDVPSPPSKLLSILR